MPDVLVFPHTRVSGWSGRDDDLPEYYPVVDLLSALRARYETDAHVTLAVPDGEVEMPRLRKSALRRLMDEGVEPAMGCVFVDLDRPGHEPWKTRDEMIEAVRLLRLLCPLAGIYTTRAGMRLVWLLDRPLPASVADSWLSAFLHSLELPGVDFACAQWTRLYRLPYVVRDGVESDPVVDFTTLEEGRTLAVDCVDPKALTEKVAAARSNAVFDESAPADPLPLGSSDWAKMSEMGPKYRHLSKALRRGEPLATAGSRNRVLMGVLGSLANSISRLDPAWAPDPHYLVSFVWRSVRAQVAEGSKHDIPTAWSLACRVCEREADRRAEEKARAAAEEPEDPDPEDNSPWIVAFPKTYFVIDEDGVPHPATDKTLYRVAHTYRPDVSLRKSEKTLHTIPEMLLYWGTQGGSVSYSMSSPSRYDRTTDEVVIRVCEPVGVPARPHTDVGDWLRYLVEDRGEYDRLLDWLATCGRLDAPTSALYLQGPPGTGKGMLAAGVASLWPAGATKFQDSISRFNDRLLQNPVVFLDEKDGAVRGQREAVSAAFRSLVSESEHRVEVKHGPVGIVFGCPRLIIAANNADALPFGSEHLTANDRRAIVERITHLTVSIDARYFIEGLGGREATEGWVRRADGKPGKIAEHIQYLAETRRVEPGKRYLVEGIETDYHRSFARSAGITDRILQIVIRSVTSSGGPMSRSGATVLDGSVYANAEQIQRQWESATGEKKKPGPRLVAAALKAVSPDRKSKAVRQADGGVLRFWRLDTRTLVEAAEEYGMAANKIEMAIEASRSLEDV